MAALLWSAIIVRMHRGFPCDERRVKNDYHANSHPPRRDLRSDSDSLVITVSPYPSGGLYIAFVSIVNFKRDAILSVEKVRGRVRFRQLLTRRT